MFCLSCTNKHTERLLSYCNMKKKFNRPKIYWRDLNCLLFTIYMVREYENQNKR